MADPTLPTKISPNDPQLLIQRPRARRMRKGKLIALLAGLAAMGTVGVMAAELGPSSDSDTASASQLPKFTAAVVPDDILKKPEQPNRRPEPPIEPAAAPSPPSAAPAPVGPAARTTPAPPEDTGPYSKAARKRARAEAYWRAREAPIAVELGIGHGSTATPPAPARALPPSTASTSPLDHAAHAGGPQALGLDDPNMQARKNDFVHLSGDDDGYLHARLSTPRSPYEVKAGTIIPISLLTAINSDLPGVIIAQVRESVYDTVSAEYLLIPQGSRLLAQYDSMIAWGQQRVLLCWNRLLLPNGKAIPLQCMPGADLAGAAGVTDEVDDHWWSIIKGAAVASLLSAATTAAAGNTTGFNPTIPQQWARGAASEIGSVGSQVTQRNIRVQPTITVRAGWSMNVIVTRDMVLEPYELGLAENVTSGAILLQRQ